MLGKLKLPFILSDANRLDRDFYSGYDERFLHRKIKVLGTLLENQGLLQQFVGEESGQEEVDRMRHALAAEVLFTEFHQFESFFAILVAPFQKLPHWIFLNTYSPGEIKFKARQFMAGKFNELSSNRAADRNTFLRDAVYQGYASESGGEEAWNTCVDNLWWIIYRMAEKYVNGDEYNSYKHGLRMMSASSTLAMSNSPTDFSTAFVLHAPHSITHLKFEKAEQGTSVSIETKSFNPLESEAHVQIMAEILANIKRVRLAALVGKERVELTLFSALDRAALQKLVVCQKWAFPA
jgi:hypothetical protein